MCYEEDGSRDNGEHGSRDKSKIASRANGEDGNRDNGEDGNRDNGEDGNRDNGEDGNRDDRVDGSRDAGVSLWLLVAYLETETRQPLNNSTLVLSQSESLESDDTAMGARPSNGSWTLYPVTANVDTCHIAVCLNTLV